MNYQRITAPFTCVVVALLLAVGAMAQQIVPLNSSRASNASFVAGKFVANEYADYGNVFGSQVYSGNASTGSSTITVRGGYIVLHDGRAVVPFAVGVPIVINDSAPELVTPTAVSGCFNAKGMNQDAILVQCSITASFSNLHGIGASISSGTGGIAEAVQDAFTFGGGVVVLEPGLYINTSCTNCYASVNAAIAAVLPYHMVSIEDDRVGPTQYWNIGGGTSLLPAPTTLTSTTVGFALNGANATGGAYTGTSTYHVCIAYVDVAGQEGPCSSDFSGLTAGTSATTYQIGIAAPAASTGAVGFVAYISLASGSYALAYSVPLTNSSCAGGSLTKIETVTPACPVTNATYGQTGSNMIVSALTVNTAPLATLLGGANNQYTGNSNGRQAYTYVPSTRLAVAGVPAVSLAFTATPGTVSSANPVVAATVNLPAGIMNVVNRSIRVCGTYTITPSSSTAKENIQLYWDAAGSDSAGTPVQIANLEEDASYTNVAYNGNFCQVLTTTVSGAGATAGSIIGGQNSWSLAIASAPTTVGAGGVNRTSSATGSLNLANTATAGYPTHLHVVQNHTTGSDGAIQILHLTIESL